MATAYWYNAALLHVARGDVDLLSDTLKVMIATSGYVPAQATDAYRDDVTNETSGTGYTAGGKTLTGVTVTEDGATGATWISWDDVLWSPPSSFTGRTAIFYKARGGASSADELICFIPFGFDQVAAAVGFELLIPDPLLRYTALSP